MPLGFEKSLYAKCILSGAHSVLRGYPALVFPIRSYAIQMQYTPTNENFSAQFFGAHKEPLEILFWGLLDVALQKLGKSKKTLNGEAVLKNSLPFGGGLGASAALSVGVGRLLQNFGFIPEAELFDFCRSLEDHFHGESSGADIAIAFYEKAIRFTRHEPIISFEPTWQPQLYLYFTGQNGMTMECINQVKAIKKTDLELFENLDRQMGESVEKCQKALLSSSLEQGFRDLVEGLRLAQDCYRDWGLVPVEVQKAEELLLKNGALQCALTGSGGGGYLMGLWKEEPPKELLGKMIPLKL